MDWEYPVQQSSSARLRAPKDGIVSADRRLQGWLAKEWAKMFDPLRRTHASRLARGRTLARSGRVRDLWFSPGTTNGEVVGREVNRVSLRFRVFEDEEWKAVTKLLLERLDLIASLLEGELPRELIELLAKKGMRLLPDSEEISGDCDCSDYLLPCAHMAAVHTVLAQALDGEPFLLLTLRGRPREQLLNDLRYAWGDTSPFQTPESKFEEAPPDTAEWFDSPTPLPETVRFSFALRPDATAIGLRALGPAPGKGDLFRALSPLYEAGAAAAAEIAHEDLQRSHDRSGRRRQMRRKKVEAPLAVRTRPTVLVADRGRQRGRGGNLKAEGRALSERIVDAVAQLEPAKTKDIAELLGEKLQKVRAELQELEQLGVLSRTGQTRATRWWLG
jgi:uncharacterized Zn finger protein